MKSFSEIVLSRKTMAKVCFNGELLKRMKHPELLLENFPLNVVNEDDKEKIRKEAIRKEAVRTLIDVIRQSGDLGVFFLLQALIEDDQVDLAHMLRAEIERELPNYRDRHGNSLHHYLPLPNDHHNTAGLSNVVRAESQFTQGPQTCSPISVSNSVTHPLYGVPSGVPQVVEDGRKPKLHNLSYQSSEESVVGKSCSFGSIGSSLDDNGYCSSKCLPSQDSTESTDSVFTAGSSISSRDNRPAYRNQYRTDDSVYSSSSASTTNEPFTLESCVSDIPRACRLEVEKLLNRTSALNKDWSGLASEFEIEDDDVQKMTGKTKDLLQELGQRLVSVRQLLTKLENLTRLDVIVTINKYLGTPYPYRSPLQSEIDSGNDECVNRYRSSTNEPEESQDDDDNGKVVSNAPHNQQPHCERNVAENSNRQNLSIRHSDTRESSLDDREDSMLRHASTRSEGPRADMDKEMHRELNRPPSLQRSDAMDSLSSDEEFFDAETSPVSPSNSRDFILPPQCLGDEKLQQECRHTYSASDQTDFNNDKSNGSDLADVEQLRSSLSRLGSPDEAFARQVQGSEPTEAPNAQQVKYNILVTQVSDNTTKSKDVSVLPDHSSGALASPNADGNQSFVLSTAPVSPVPTVASHEESTAPPLPYRKQKGANNELCFADSGGPSQLTHKNVVTGIRNIGLNSSQSCEMADNPSACKRKTSNYSPKECGHRRQAVFISNLDNSSGDNSEYNCDQIQLKDFLMSWGWEVESHSNLGPQPLKDLLRELSERDPDLLMLIFTGNVGEVDGFLYLLPCNIAGQTKSRLKSEGYYFNDFLKNAKAKACLFLVNAVQVKTSNRKGAWSFVPVRSSEMRANYAVLLGTPQRKTKEPKTQRTLLHICKSLQEKEDTNLLELVDALNEEGGNWEYFSRSKSILPIHLTDPSKPEAHCTPGIICPKTGDRKHLLYITPPEPPDAIPGWTVDTIISRDNQSLREGFETFLEKMNNIEESSTLIVYYEGPIVKVPNGEKYVVTGGESFCSLPSENAVNAMETTLQWLIENLLEDVIGPKVICLSITEKLDYDESLFHDLPQEVLVAVANHEEPSVKQSLKYRQHFLRALRESGEIPVFKIMQEMAEDQHHHIYYGNMFYA